MQEKFLAKSKKMAAHVRTYVGIVFLHFYQCTCTYINKLTNTLTVVMCKLSALQITISYLVWNVSIIILLNFFILSIYLVCGKIFKY